LAVAIHHTRPLRNRTRAAGVHLHCPPSTAVNLNYSVLLSAVSRSSTSIGRALRRQGLSNILWVLCLYAISSTALPCEAGNASKKRVATRIFGGDLLDSAATSWATRIARDHPGSYTGISGHTRRTYGLLGHYRCLTQCDARKLSTPVFSLLVASVSSANLYSSSCFLTCHDARAFSSSSAPACPRLKAL